MRNPRGPTLNSPNKICKFFIASLSYLSNNLICYVEINTSVLHLRSKEARGNFVIPIEVIHFDQGLTIWTTDFIAQLTLRWTFVISGIDTSPEEPLWLWSA